MSGICGRRKGPGKAEKTMGGRRERMDRDDDGGLCEEREEQGAMEEDDVVDSGLRSAAMRMVTTTTTLFEDNQSCIKLLQNEKSSHRTKHVATKFHFVRDLYKSKKLDVKYCPSERMIADLL